jgi:uncharacterized protein (DUF433 family)
MSPEAKHGPPIGEPHWAAHRAACGGDEVVAHLGLLRGILSKMPHGLSPEVQPRLTSRRNKPAACMRSKRCAVHPDGFDQMTARRSASSRRRRRDVLSGTRFEAAGTLPETAADGRAISCYEHLMKIEEAFERDPKICGGQTVLRGTRVLLRTVLASLAEGATFEEILRDFPTLTIDHLRAAVAFAASSAQEDLPVPSVPAV